ncbi:MAG: acyl-CoA thioesterase [Thermodesulfobacteriota bacterium]
MAKTMHEQFPEPSTCWEHHVSYGETDGMGIAYYGNYLHWFEQARSDFLRKMGMTYSGIEGQNIYLPVREAYCRYLASAAFDDKISVKTGIGKWCRASMYFFYEIYNMSNADKLITTGYTQHACIDQSGKPIAIPQWLRNITTAC